MVGVPSWCGLEAKMFEKGQYRIVGLRVVENSILLLEESGGRIEDRRIPDLSWLPESSLSQTAVLYMDPKILKFLKTQNSILKFLKTQNSVKLSNSILGDISMRTLCAWL